MAVYISDNNGKLIRVAGKGSDGQSYDDTVLRNLVNSKASNDASNLTDENISSWITKLGVKNVTRNLVWYNPSPNTSWSRASASFIANNYDFYEVILRYDTANTIEFITYLNGEVGARGLTNFANTPLVVRARSFQLQSTSSIMFEQCYKSSSSSSESADNTFLIPYKIYGWKFS